MTGHLLCPSYKKGYPNTIYELYSLTQFSRKKPFSCSSHFDLSHCQDCGLTLYRHLPLTMPKIELEFLPQMFSSPSAPYLICSSPNL